MLLKVYDSVSQMSGLLFPLEKCQLQTHEKPYGLHQKVDTFAADNFLTIMEYEGFIAMFTKPYHWIYYPEPVESFSHV